MSIAIEGIYFLRQQKKQSFLKVLLWGEIDSRASEFLGFRVERKFAWLDLDFNRRLGKPTVRLCLNTAVEYLYLLWVCAFPAKLEFMLLVEDSA